MSHRFKITAKLWKYESKAAWYFLTIEKETAEEIKALTEPSFGGWGQIKVEAQIGKTKWQTSIFPDKKSQGYLLPVKKDVRKAENINEGDQINLVFKTI